MLITLSALPFILFSVTGYALFYNALRGFALEWILRWFLGDRLKIETQQTAQPQDQGNGAVHNDKVHANRASSKVTTEDKLGAVCVTDGDMAKVANLSISILMAILTSIVSVILMWETRENIVFSPSSLVVPYVHFAEWYLVADLITYYKSFVLRKNLGHLPLLKRMLLFAKFERAILVHHVFIFVIGYPICCDEAGIRNGRGNFLIGAFMAQEFSNPFQNMAIILRTLKQQQSKMYFWNGVILVPVYFVVRILNIPLVFLIYAAQFHNWDLFAALNSMYISCHAFNLIQLSLQLVWFTAIIRIAIKAGMLKLPRNKPNTSQEQTPNHAKSE